ncbi:MAG: DUF1722 domain-containing protein [Myxococcales bacterium]|nr:DUF1722 domain-containing protein [Myxococcales bacterium]
MPGFARPTLVASRCLGFAACRWDGEIVRSEAVQKLLPHVRFITHCPEEEIGLGTPRRPIRVIEENGEQRLYQPDTGLDFTAPMREWSRKILAGLPPVEGFVLKSRSPSCGLADVKLHRGKAGDGPTRRTAGFFGGEVLERYGDLAVEDEGRLTNFVVRERFLIRVFTLAEFRETRRAGDPGRLVAFQARHKLLFMACHQTAMRALGRIVANHERLPFAEVAARYEETLLKLLRGGPKTGNTVNVLMHALGYFKKTLRAGEKGFFLDLLEAYRNGQTPLSAPVSVLRSWIERTDEDYLRRQSFFEPYPRDLLDLGDSGRGRDY